jgi:CheY-like chemotaxis protein
VDDPVTERPAIATEPARHGTETILLVEDEGTLRELVANMLRERGHTVLEADGAAAAMQIADRHPGVIDLLLSDVIMPGESGPQVAREVARRRPAIKVAFMSGYSNEALGARGILDPGTILLVKPFTGAALDSCLSQALGDSPKMVVLEAATTMH